MIERVEGMGPGTLTSERLLVRGEGRFHGHYIEGAAVSVVEAQPQSNGSGGIVTHYLHISDSAELVHRHTETGQATAEHAPITLPPGIYRVVRQREYNPYAKAIRAVRD